MWNSTQLIILALFTTTACAQPTIAWQHNYGGSAVDAGRSIHPTLDGGYIVFAHSSSNDGQLTENRGLPDYWAVKINGSGELEWQRSLGSSGVEYPGDMWQTPDGGYIGIGTITTADGDVSSITGYSDIWVVKLDALGALVWERSFGGSLIDRGLWLHVLTNGQILLFGETNSPEIEGEIGESDTWVVRITSDGTELQQQRFGGSLHDIMGYFGYLSNGSVVFSGSTYSTDGQATGNHGGSDGMIISLDEDLNLNWHTCIGGSSYENAGAICESADGSIYVASSALSLDGQISNARGGGDYWIVKLSSDGELLGESSFGGSESDLPLSILPRANGGVYVYGTVISEDGDISASHGDKDAWLICLDADLNLRWERALGGSSSDFGGGMCYAPDGGLVLVGTSGSTDGDLTGNFGGGDLWVVKFNPEVVGISEVSEAFFTLYPNPATDELRISLTGTAARQLEVVDVTGRIVITQAVTSGTTTVDLSIPQLAQGTYSVRLVGDGQNYSELFIKY